MSDSQSASLQSERAFYVGMQMQCFLVGVNTLLAFLALLHLHRRSSPFSLQQKIFYTVYSMIMAVLILISYVTNGLMGQLMWIDHRDVPGGPYEYFAESSAAWWNIWGSAVDIAANIAGDGFLLWRCYIVYSGDIRVILFPVMVYLASVALSIVTLVESANPNDSSFFNVGQLINFTVPWLALSSVLNVIITALIAYRILRLRRKERAALANELDKFELGSSYDRRNGVDIYTSVVAMLIESALPLSTLGVVTSILVGIDNFASTTFLCVWGTVAGIAPLLIVVRITMGLGWTQETIRLGRNTTMVFAPAPASHRTWTSTTSAPLEAHSSKGRSIGYPSAYSTTLNGSGSQAGEKT